MIKPFLKVSYRRGKPFAAYLYLERPNDMRIATTRRIGRVVVDFDSAGGIVGVDIYSIAPGIAAEVTALLRDFGTSAIDDDELAPLNGP